MAGPSLTLISPTFGRTTLIDLIASVLPQLGPDDEFIVVGDGPVPLAQGICKEFPRVTYMETPVHTGDFGCTPCDYAIERAKGDFIMFVGDDDLMANKAFELVRNGVQERPDLPHLFAMMHTGRVLCDSREVGQVSGQQLVVPRDLDKMPKMSDVGHDQMLTSDWVFIDKVIRRWKGVVYHPDIICILQQQNFGAAL